MVSEDQAEKAVDWIRDNAQAFAEARATRVYLEEFRKSKKAILYQQADDGPVAEREAYAYAHPDYLEVLDGLRAAVEQEERLRWLMVAAQARIETWRTQSANERKG